MQLPYARARWYCRIRAAFLAGKGRERGKAMVWADGLCTPVARIQRDANEGMRCPLPVLIHLVDAGKGLSHDRNWGQWREVRFSHQVVGMRRGRVNMHKDSSGQQQQQQQWPTVTTANSNRGEATASATTEAITSRYLALRRTRHEAAEGPAGT